MTLLSVFQYLLIIAIVFGCLYWLVSTALIVWVVRRVPMLCRLAPSDPPRWPSLSLVVPACDEVDTLEAATAAKLTGDYPELEIILIDDRSRDGTGALVDRLAAADPRVRAMHIRELPDGWLGKVYAMHRGLAEATGEWVLFSDADVHLAPDTLRRAIAYCESRGLDHLAVLPEMWSGGFLVDTTMTTAARCFVATWRIWAIEDPKSKAAAGIGAFNLCRRSALDRTAGFEWIKLEVADVLALGQMLKTAGARSTMINGREKVGVRWYKDWWEMCRGFERGGFAGLGRYSFTRMVVACSFMLFGELSPLLAVLLPIGGLPLRILGLAAMAAGLVATCLIIRWLNRPILASLFVPLGPIIMVSLMIRGGILALLRGGISWRGTLYTTRELKEGMRYTFP